MATKLKMKTKTKVCKSKKCRGKMRTWQRLDDVWACKFCGEVE